MDIVKMAKQRAQTTNWFLVGDSWPNPGNKPNQDSVYYTSEPLSTLSGCPSALALVCDGVGGQPGGEEASALAIKTLQSILKPLLLRDDLTAETQQSLLDQALTMANQAIFQRNQALGHPPEQRMATTVVAAWLYADHAVLAHVGDSRAYAFTPEQGLTRLTTDHTALELDLRRGLITPEESRSGDYHGGEALTQALGMREKVSPDFKVLPLHPGLILMLCSDGIYKPLGGKRLARVLAAEGSTFSFFGFLRRKQTPTEHLSALEHELLRQVQRRKGKDDATLVLIYVDQ